MLATKTQITLVCYSVNKIAARTEPLRSYGIVNGSENIATDRNKLKANDSEFQRRIIHTHCCNLNVQNAKD